MMEGGKGGRPDRELEDWNIQSIREQQNREIYTSLLRDDTFCKIFDEGLAYQIKAYEELFREKPDPIKSRRFDLVEQQLDYIRDGFGGYNPDGTWKRIHLDRKSQNDIYMITRGFEAVAYEHITDPNQSGIQFQLKRHFERNLREHNEYIRFGTGRELRTDTPFHENRREFLDRFELTYEQAKAVQQVAKRVNLSYDPGGRELTPENIAKRTFYAKDYLNRPIRR